MKDISRLSVDVSHVFRKGGCLRSSCRYQIFPRRPSPRWSKPQIISGATVAGGDFRTRWPNEMLAACRFTRQVAVLLERWPDSIKDFGLVDFDCTRGATRSEFPCCDGIVIFKHNEEPRRELKLVTTGHRISVCFSFTSMPFACRLRVSADLSLLLLSPAFKILLTPILAMLFLLSYLAEIISTACSANASTGTCKCADKYRDHTRIHNSQSGHTIHLTLTIHHFAHTTIPGGLAHAHRFHLDTLVDLLIRFIQVVMRMSLKLKFFHH